MIDNRRDQEQWGMKWLLPKMKAGRDPVLHSESDEFTPWRVNHIVPWIYESSLMIQEMPKPTAQKAACIACNLKQGRQLRQLRRDEQGPWVRRFSKYLWETFSRVRSRKAAGQTLISSSVLHAYA